MSPSQKKAVERHRKRQSEKGIVRLEINIPESDRKLLRATAAQLRAGGPNADQIRTVLESSLTGNELVDFKQFLELAPMEDIDLERNKDTNREMEF